MDAVSNALCCFDLFVNIFCFFSGDDLFNTVAGRHERVLFVILSFGAALFLYLVTRIADRTLSRLIAFVLVFYVLVNFFINSKASLATFMHSDYSIVHLVTHVIPTVALLASIYHDHWHVVEGPPAAAVSSPRRGRKKKE
jgi:hypothetical protein